MASVLSCWITVFFIHSSISHIDMWFIISCLSGLCSWYYWHLWTNQLLWFILFEVKYCVSPNVNWPPIFPMMKSDFFIVQKRISSCLELLIIIIFIFILKDLEIRWQCNSADQIRFPLSLHVCSSNISSILLPQFCIPWALGQGTSTVSNCHFHSTYIHMSTYVYIFVMHEPLAN